MPGALHIGAEHRLRHWLTRRKQPRTTPFTLVSRQIYILPTRSGLYFAVLVLVMLLGSLNYSNSLGFVLTFLLAALGLVSMHHTQRNLLRLRLQSVCAAPVHAGDEAQFVLTLTNPTRLPRHAIGIIAARHDDTAQQAARRVSIGANAHAQVTVACPAPRRGRMPCPPLRVDSRYPLGLFGAWSLLHVAAEVMVYPRAHGDQPLPWHTGSGRYTAASADHGDADFSGHRDYVPGDSPRRIDWKASARSDTLMVTRHNTTRDETLWLDADALTHLPLEARLSQLARWVLDADATGLRYGLCLGGNSAGTVAPNSGEAHKHACLRMLALQP